MIIDTIDSYRIPFIPSQNYVMWGYNYKSINVTKPGTYVKDFINYYLFTKFKSSCFKSGLRIS